MCQAAIISAGYSPGLGFIHTGKTLSFAYDIADLYKADLTIPLAFEVVAEGAGNLESRVRRACRDTFHQRALLARIVPDIERALSAEPVGAQAQLDFDADDALPGGWWDPLLGEVAGGINRAGGGDDDDSPW